MVVRLLAARRAAAGHSAAALRCPRWDGLDRRRAGLPRMAGDGTCEGRLRRAELQSNTAAYPTERLRGDHARRALCNKQPVSQVIRGTSTPSSRHSRAITSCRWRDALNLISTQVAQRPAPPGTRGSTAVWYFAARGTGVWLGVGASTEVVGGADAAWREPAALLRARAAGVSTLQAPSSLRANMALERFEVVDLRSGDREATACAGEYLAGAAAALRPCACEERLGYANCGGAPARRAAADADVPPAAPRPWPPQQRPTRPPRPRPRRRGPALRAGPRAARRTLDVGTACFDTERSRPPSGQRTWTRSTGLSTPQRFRSTCGA